MKRPTAFLRNPFLRPVSLLLWAAGVICLPALADDIDIYASGSTDAAMPNVLLFLDNTSNWSAANQAWSASSVWSSPLSCQTLAGAAKTSCITTYQADPKTKTNIEKIFYYGIAATQKRPWDAGFSANHDDVKLKQGQVELRSLRAVVNDLVCSPSGANLKLKVGLMLFNDQGSARSNGDRPGYIRRAVVPLTGTADTAGSTCKTLIDDLTTIDTNITNPEFKGPSNADYGSALFEAFKYFGGYTNPGLLSTNTPGSPSGAQGYGPVRFSNSTTLEDAAAFTTASKTTYKSPITTDGACGPSYLVVVGNTYPNAEPAGPASFSGLNYTPTALSEPNDPTRYADEWAHFLANTDISSIDNVQHLYTYAINVYKDQPSSTQTNLLKSMANVGGASGAYIEVGGDLSKMIDAFSQIFISVSATNSVFTATTLPVSTTTQGSYLNQLFIGMFRPDGDAKPRWVGNLKQYKLGMTSTGDVQVVDAAAKPAVLHGSSGFFDPQAVSFWTESSVFFANNPSGTPQSSSDSPDGQIVEKGGVAQQLRKANLTGAGARKVYTLPASPSPGTALSATPFSTANAAIKAAPYLLSNDDINWVRGENNLTSGAGAEFYGSYLAGGSVVTSLSANSARPSIHGDILHSRPVAVNYGSSGIVVFYGSNDGTLRAVNGSQTGSGGGQELWSFIAPEHYSMLQRQRNDTPELYLPTTTSSGGVATQPSDTQKKDYAMDGPIGVFARYSASGNLTEGIIYVAMRRGGRTVYAFDVTHIDAPLLKWKISNTNPDFAKLAQTWSMPKAVIFPPSFSVDPLVFMGGGYDPAEDTNSSGSIGNRIYVVNGRTGVKLAEFNTDYSVAGDVTVVDVNSDGVYDRAYVADVRGNVYRINMTDSVGTLRPMTDWTIKKIANVGGKVFHAPDVVVTRNYISVLVGTGDREKPLLISTNDRFFLIKDTRLGEADRDGFLTTSSFTRVAKVSESSTDVAEFTYVDDHVDDPEGCYIELSTKGEKVVNTPFTIAGATYFGTNRPTPSDNTCTGSLGQARTYQFPLFCGVPKAAVLSTGGMPPSPVGGLVNMVIDGKTTLVPFLIGSGTGSSPFEATRPRPPITPVRKRNFWHVTDGNR